MREGETFDRTRTLPIILLDLVGLGLGGWGAATANPAEVGAAGLIQVLPAQWWCGLAALVVAFTLVIRWQSPTGLLALQPALLAVVLYGTPSLMEPFARNPVAYVHVGLVEHVVRTGELLQNYDARYEWPGAIGLGAALTVLTGVDSATAFLKWSPLLFTLLWSIPIWVIGRSLFGRPEHAASAVWLSLVVNWVGQEYWSPQALAFFLFLSGIALVVKYSPERPPQAGTSTALLLGARTGGPVPRWDLPLRSTPPVVIGVALIAAAIATAHQLTPFVLVLSLVVVVVVGRRDLGVLPLVATLLAVGWFSWGATRYWDNETNKAFLTQDVGNVTKIVSDGVIARVGRGSGLRTIVLAARVAFAGVVLAASAVTAIHHHRDRSARLAAALLFAPIPLVAVQGYGGELILRLFLFAAPFAAILLAPLLVEALRSRGRRFALVVVVLGASVPTFVLCRFGNEEFEQILPEDMAAATYVRSNSPDGTVITEVNPFSPFRIARIETLAHRQVLELARPDLHDPIDALRERRIRQSFLLITTGQDVYGSRVQGGPENWVARVVERVTTSGTGEVVFRRGRAVVLWIEEPQS